MKHEVKQPEHMPIRYSWVFKEQELIDMILNIITSKGVGLPDNFEKAYLIRGSEETELVILAKCDCSKCQAD